MVSTRSKQNLTAIPVVSLGLDPGKRAHATKSSAKATTSAPKKSAGGVKKAARGRGGGARARARAPTPAPAPAPGPAAAPLPADAAPADVPAETAAPTASEPTAPPACPICPRLQRRINRRDHTILDLKEHIEKLEMNLQTLQKLNRIFDARAIAEFHNFNAANAVIRSLGGTEVQRVEPAAEEEEGGEEAEGAKAVED